MDNNGGNNPVVRRRVDILLHSPVFLPRTEILGGYIFLCSNRTMQESLRRLLFGLSEWHIDSVRAIRPGLPLFIYNYEVRMLYGIFEADSFGGVDIDPTAWPDRSIPGRSSRFPAQVRIRRRTMYPPLGDVMFRSLIHHYSGDRFRVELTVPEAISIMDLFMSFSYNQ